MRLAGSEDLAALIQLEASFPPADRFDRPTWRRLMSGHCAVLVEDNQQSGGLAGAAVMLFRWGTQVARLYSLVVSPHHRGQGHAHRLLDACVSTAIIEGCDRLRLEVRASNTSAISLYERFGFRVFARTPSYYDDGETALRMEYSLGPDILHSDT